MWRTVSTEACGALEIFIYSFPQHTHKYTHSTNTNTATDGALDADYAVERDAKYLVKEYQRVESLV